MNKDAKIFIAGHNGLVGSAILRGLSQKGYTNILTRTRKELDLGNQAATRAFFEAEKPEYVFLAAAKVGGIMANNTYRADFIYENLQIQNNIIHSSWQTGVKKLLFLGSSCIYPKNAPQPMKEDCLLTDVLEYTNEPYAIAKIAGIKMCESYNLQYGTNYISVMPTNLYGPNDNYDLEKSHVLPALIRKMHLAHCLETSNWEALTSDFNKLPVEGINGNAPKAAILAILAKYGIVGNDEGNVSVNLWGTGTPYREFLHSDDMAAACIYLMESVDFKDIVAASGEKEIRNTHINIGVGHDLTINELANIVKRTTGFTGHLNWDSSKPDGTFRKLMNVSKLEKLGWKATITLDKGIDSVYKAYTVR
ncbi:GDP-L-fucose synthase [Breznakibacter xylanolyticus]|uniref:GDP-L-fucose synthase n=1 Tax=Breznakibacter xylanolyticus TaxID=990 RepID=A0A2W7P4K6_9BACT|nr:GDP-L-fucose synthase [Breznakibacter xylanolyticus]PZX20286.1 GDP-L-fucose synthase [Breznakibacter xylanolyticus]